LRHCVRLIGLKAFQFFSIFAILHIIINFFVLPERTPAARAGHQPQTRGHQPQKKAPRAGHQPQKPPRPAALVTSHN
jgi:hypothetical protein